MQCRWAAYLPGVLLVGSPASARTTRSSTLAATACARKYSPPLSQPLEIMSSTADMAPSWAKYSGVVFARRTSYTHGDDGEMAVANLLLVVAVRPTFLSSWVPSSLAASSPLMNNDATARAAPANNCGSGASLSAQNRAKADLTAPSTPVAAIQSAIVPAENHTHQPGVTWHVHKSRDPSKACTVRGQHRCQE